MFFCDVQISLSSFNYFKQSRSCTLWLAPCSAPSDGLQCLYDSLLGVFPDCDDLSNDAKRNITRFTPHLSVGQWPTAAACAQARDEIQSSWETLDFIVSDVCIIHRRGAEPFTVRYRISLGGNREPLEVCEPYHATT